MEEVKIGDILYREIHSSYASTVVKQYTVTKIGRKYFYCNGDEKTGINKTDLRHKDETYSQFSFQLYLTEQEIEDKNEVNILTNKIKKEFDWGSNYTKFSLNQLRDIAKILMLE